MSFFRGTRYFSVPKVCISQNDYQKTFHMYIKRLKLCTVFDCEYLRRNEIKTNLSLLFATDSRPKGHYLKIIPRKVCIVVE